MRGQKAGPRMCWMAYYLVGQQSFTCAEKSYWKEAAKYNLGMSLVSSFLMLVLALLVSLASETQPMPAWINFSIQSVLALVGSHLRDYFVCMLQ